VGDTNGLVERLMKGSSYYKMQLLQHSKTLLLHLESMKLQKRVKSYLTHLTELDQTLTKKLEEVDKAVFLTEAILRGDEKIELKHLTQERSRERSALLAEVRAQVEKEPSSVKKKMTTKGRKSKKVDSKSTYDVTIELLNSGMTVEQIARERELAQSTIETHLAKAVAADKIGVFTFMQEAAVMEIVNAYRQLPEGATSKDLFDKLKGKFGYGQLRAALAHAKKVD